MSKLNAVLQLRRDNDYNYAKVKNSFVPLKGEICLIDTARSGLRAVCGDGITPFGNLEFIDSIFQIGYLADNTFYSDVNLTLKVTPSTNLLYIDKLHNGLYYFDGESYQNINQNIPTASAEVPGIMKLYTATGQNVDGTMTQKAITDELSEKFEIELSPEEELIIFTND